MTDSRSQVMVDGGRTSFPLPRASDTLGSFVPLSWLLVSFTSVKRDVAEVGRLAKLVFNSILYFGLSSLLPGNVLIGSLPVPSAIYYFQGSLESLLLVSSLSCLITDCQIFCSFQSLPTKK
uniref:cDNA FLJ27405 fis, clone WMC04032 n=1 Tax=Homo sapiens TaxID=9606 RepID=Q6ZNP4_HUMAN|nr:unnamed protein product [Homo sapiens]